MPDPIIPRQSHATHRFLNVSDPGLGSYASARFWDMVAQEKLKALSFRSRWSHQEADGFLDHVRDRGFVPVVEGDSGDSKYGTWARGGFVLFVGKSGEEYSLQVAGETADIATKEMLDLLAYLPAMEPDAEMVPVRFWSLGHHGPECRVRAIVAPDWGEIAENYPERACAGVSSLVRRGPSQFDSGHLVLFHGAPGTGKTYAIRALLKTWRSWCRGQYIVDPDAFFDKAHYMMQVAIDESADSEDNKWSLILVEDADEYISVDAKQRSGQALARLLNLTDGLVGQGLRLLVLVTTNEPLQKLHPAVSRTGRCVANVEFLPFSPQESETWLQARGCSESVTETKSLAELFRIASDDPQILVQKEEVPTGFRPYSKAPY